jgi:hypothetical protein
MVFLPTRGRPGGLLIGVRTDFMKVLTNSDGEYHIKLTTRNRADNFIRILISVYGVDQEKFKANFLRELVNLAKDDLYHILIGGF